MKKIVSIILCLAMMFSLTACRIEIDGEGSSAKQTKASGSIGLSVSTQNNPFFVTLVEGAEAAAASAEKTIQEVRKIIGFRN